MSEVKARMDLKLEVAAKSGDVRFLKEAIASQPPDDYSYFLSPSNGRSGNEGNIFHLAAWEYQVEFFKQAMETLPQEIVLVLLSQQDFQGRNPLHDVAISSDRLEILRLILGFYKSYTPSPSPSTSPIQPWLALDVKEQTPLHRTLEFCEQENAMELLSMDMQLLCNMVDVEGNSPLFLAVKHGCHQVAENILMSSFSYSLTGESGSSALHVTTLLTPDVILRLLLTKHQELVDIVDNQGYNVLHKWAELGDVRPLTLLLQEEEFSAARTKVFRNLITHATAKTRLYTDAVTNISDYSYESPLHIAAEKFSEEFLEVLVKGIQQEIMLRAATTPDLADCSPSSPWKIQNKFGDTPLHTAIQNHNEAHALQFLSLDPTLCYSLNNHGESPLFLAFQTGLDFDQLVDEILKITHDLPSNSLYQRHDKLTVLHFLSRSSDDKLKLLLTKHQDLIDAVDDSQGANVLHYWTNDADVRALKLLLEEEELSLSRTKVFRDCIAQQEKESGVTPLHIAACLENEEFVRVLVQGIQQEKNAATTSELPADCSPTATSPWNIQDNYGHTPLHYAIDSEKQAHALLFLSADPTSCHLINKQGESPLFFALNKMTSDRVNFDQLIIEILKMNYLPFNTLCRTHDRVTVLHFLPECSEKIGKLLLEKFWWMMKLCDNNGISALDKAREKNIKWLVNLLTKPNLIQREPFNWMKACETPDEVPAVIAFVATCYDLHVICREQNDTPLHHIEFQNDAQCVKFFESPYVAKIKSIPNSEGETPLHIALQKKNIILAKTLLSDSGGIDRTTEDNYRTTPMDLLAKHFKEDEKWADMCREIKVYPFLRTIYLKPGTELDKIRNTLSVVAALLATITFAAGFTLPGGLNSDTGDAILAKKAAFLVFLLSDVYAMCTSMLVLFCLIWSMVSARDLSNFLVDRSVLLLMQALYGTLVAFMTGIFLVMAHSSLWAAVIILIMCSIIGILANRTFLYFVFALFSQIIYRDRTKHKGRDSVRLLEEGSSTGSGDDNTRKVE